MTYVQRPTEEPSPVQPRAAIHRIIPAVDLKIVTPEQDESSRDSLPFTEGYTLALKGYSGRRVPVTDL